MYDIIYATLFVGMLICMVGFLGEGILIERELKK